MAHCWEHRCTTGVCWVITQVLFIGNHEARGASGEKYKARIAIFRILLAINRFSWFSRKAESRWGKSESRWRNSESRWRNLESHWRKQKAVEESRKPSKKVRKPMRKIGFQEGKILIFAKRFFSIWQFWRLIFLRNLLPRVRTDLLCWTQVLTTKIKSS